MISAIAKFYDPLGWLSPVIITVKIFIQKLWLCNLDWDDGLPLELKDEFLNWYSQVSVLNNIKINRSLNYSLESKCKIFGFAVASKIAFGACVCLKITFQGTSVKLVQAKPKVAQIKPLLTIPRLELNAAVLLARLTVRVICALKLLPDNVFLYTDSIRRAVFL